MPAFTLTGNIPGSAAAAAVGLQPQTLDAGVSVQIGTAITAAAGSGNTPQTPCFCLQTRLDGGDRSLLIVPEPNGTVTTLTVNLLASYDNGATWQVFGTSGAMGGAPLQAAEFKNLPAGALFSLACATLVLGTATSLNLAGSVS